VGRKCAGKVQNTPVFVENLLKFVKKDIRSRYAPTWGGLRCVAREWWGGGVTKMEVFWKSVDENNACPFFLFEPCIRGGVLVRF